MSEWIPVSERLPNPKKDVLAYDGTDMFVAWYFDNEMWQGWSSYNSQFDRYTPIIAWMPLPEPYRAENEDKEIKDEKL